MKEDLETFELTHEIGGISFLNIKVDFLRNGLRNFTVLLLIDDFFLVLIHTGIAKW